MGMHRSGTSAVAGALRAAGAFGGLDEDLPWAGLENPDGYHEMPDIVHFNDGVLRSLGWAWDAAPADPPAELVPRDADVATARGLVERRLGPSASWYMKDPRMALLLPWWRRILLDRFVAVVPVRPALEVAWSLAVRDGHPIELGLALWMAHHRYLAAGLSGLPVVILDYVALVERPGEVVQDLFAALGQVGITLPHGATGAVGAVRSELRRDTRPPVSPDVEDLVAACEDLRRSWLPEPVVAHGRFSATVPPASLREGSVLLAQRRLRNEWTRAEQAEISLKLAEDGRVRAEADAADAHAEAELRTRERDDATRDGDQATRDRGQAVLERDGAILERDDATRERDQAILERDGAILERDDATRERDQATRDRDDATRERDQALAEAARLRTQRDESRERADEITAGAGLMRTALEANRAQSDHLVRIISGRHSTTIGRSAARLERLGLAHGARPGLIRRGAHAIGRVLTLRWPPGLRANPLFDRPWYLSQNADVAATRIDPYRHYRRHGVPEGRDPNAWFDTDWYLRQNPDVAARRLDPLDHYLEHGWLEGRDPGPAFSTLGYLGDNPDVLVAGVNPLLHFLRHGHKEGRTARPEATNAAEALSGRVGRVPADAATVRASASPGRTSERAPVVHLTELDRIRAVRATLPADARVAVATLADAAWLKQAREIRVEPLVAPAGGSLLHDTDGHGIVGALERARRDGADHLLVPTSTSWWLDRYPDLRRYLARFGAPSTTHDTLLWRIALPVVTREVDGLLATLTALLLRAPVVLCWDAPGGLEPGALPGAEAFAAPEPAGQLPYLDHSIDVVAISRSDEGRLADAMRVASWAVILVTNRRPQDASVLWSSPTLQAAAAISVILTGSAQEQGVEHALARVRDALPSGARGEVVLIDDDPAAILVRRPSADPRMEVRVLGRADADLRSAVDAAANGLVLVLDGSGWPVPGAVEALVGALRPDPVSPVVAGVVLGAPPARSTEPSGPDDGDPVPLAFALIDRVALLEALATRPMLPATITAGESGYRLPRSLVTACADALAVPDSFEAPEQEGPVGDQPAPADLPEERVEDSVEDSVA